MNGIADRDQFLKHIEAINSEVGSLLDDRAFDATHIFDRVRMRTGGGKQKVDDEIFDFAIELLKPAERGEADGRSSTVMQLLQACRQEAPRDAQLDSDRSDALLMEYLTAAWLGLYFRGIPFIQLWEKVCWLAENRGGFPTGACIAKFTGDVYRAERQQIASGSKAGRHPEGVLVLSYIPLPLRFKKMLEFKETGLAPRSVSQLALRYAFLQMHMYLAEGHPIRFFVPAEALRVKLAAPPPAPSHGAAAASAAGDHAALQEMGSDRAETMMMWETFRDVFGTEPKNDQQLILVKEAAATLAMPTCVLGTKTGIYTMETGSRVLHFAGNRIGRDLLKSYRARLGRLLQTGGTEATAEGDDQFVVLSLSDENKFARQIHKALKGARENDPQ